MFPLDVPTLSEAEHWIDRLSGPIGVYKVGLELFTRAGPAAVAAVHRRQARCFLDMKLHDIPATVAGAVRAASDLGVAYLTIHSAMGPDGLERAARAAEGTHTVLLAVTVLTSLDAHALAAVGVNGSVEDAVRTRARLSHEAGIRGFVCSPLEVATLRALFGPAATLVVPGIRPEATEKDDQVRTATPTATLAAGADLLVIGRPIRHARDPLAAAESIAEEVSQATGPS